MTVGAYNTNNQLKPTDSRLTKEQYISLIEDINLRKFERGLNSPFSSHHNKTSDIFIYSFSDGQEGSSVFLMKYAGKSQF